MNYIIKRPHTGARVPFSGLLDNFFGPLGQINLLDDSSGNLPRVNIMEQEQGYQLELLAPGFAKDELRMNVQEDMLTISADQEKEEETTGEHYTRREFSKQSFSRSFRLPDHVDADAIKAEHLNGVLKVTLPKKKDVKPSVKQINIG